jgi:transcriptional pleiotropic regulator of transition state genes
LPKEIRDKLSIRTAIEKGNQDRPDSLEIFVDRDKIILRRYDPACIFCGNAEGTINYNCRLICKQRIESLFYFK